MATREELGRANGRQNLTGRQWQENVTQNSGCSFEYSRNSGDKAPETGHTRRREVNLTPTTFKMNPKTIVKKPGPDRAFVRKTFFVSP